MHKDVDIELLKFLEPTGYIVNPKDITGFILKHFTRPDTTDLTLLNTNDEAYIMLVTMIEDELIEITQGDLYQIIQWEFTNPKDGKVHKHWYDTIEPRLSARISRFGIEELRQHRQDERTNETQRSSLLTDKSVRATNKNTLRVLIGTFLVSIINLGVGIYTTSKSNDTTELRTQLREQNKLIKSQQLIISQQQNRLTSLLRESKVLSKKK